MNDENIDTMNSTNIIMKNIQMNNENIDNVRHHVMVNLFSSRSDHFLLSILGTG